MNYTAAQRFMTPTEFYESMKLSATKVEGAPKVSTTKQSSSSGLSVGQVIVVGITVVVVTYQIIKWLQQMEKVLYPENQPNGNYSNRESTKK